MVFLFAFVGEHAFRVRCGSKIAASGDAQRVIFFFTRELRGRCRTRSRTGAPCNKGVGDVGTGPNSRTEQNRTRLTRFRFAER